MEAFSRGAGAAREERPASSTPISVKEPFGKCREQPGLGIEELLHAPEVQELIVSSIRVAVAEACQTYIRSIRREDTVLRQLHDMKQSLEVVTEMLGTLSAASSCKQSPAHTHGDLVLDPRGAAPSYQSSSSRRTERRSGMEGSRQSSFERSQWLERNTPPGRVMSLEALHRAQEDRVLMEAGLDSMPRDGYSRQARGSAQPAAPDDSAPSTGVAPGSSEPSSPQSGPVRLISGPRTRASTWDTLVPSAGNLQQLQEESRPGNRGGANVSTRIRDFFRQRHSSPTEVRQH